MFGLFKKKEVALPSAPKNLAIPTVLEQQLETLAALGLRLSEGVSIDDFLSAASRKDYEDEPFNMVLFTLGSTIEHGPRGRPICPTVWDFDTECIDAMGDYEDIVEHLCRIAQKPGCLEDVTDFIDMETEEGWLTFGVDGRKVRLELEVNGDWADVDALVEVMAWIEDDEHHFYFKDNGQAMVLFYLDDGTATELNRLSKGALGRVVSESSDALDD